MPNNNTIPSRKDWYIKEGEISSELQLEGLTKYYISDMFNKTLRMFHYENLPDDIMDKDMEKFTQLQGQSFFIKHNDRFYVLYGSFSDWITWNVEPKKALIVNPALPDLKTEYLINDDVIVIPNDLLYVGIYPILENNAVQMAQCDISIMFAEFNVRLKSLFTANDDTQKDSLNTLIDDIWNGKKPSAIVTDDMYKSSIESKQYTTGQSNDIQNLIELKQYIKANWYIDLGINANYNMKRETLNGDEVHVNDDALMPLIDNMLECRKQAVQKINDKWGLNITVDLSSAWKKIKDEIINEEKQEKAETEIIENKASEPVDETPANDEPESEVLKDAEN